MSYGDAAALPPGRLAWRMEQRQREDAAVAASREITRCGLACCGHARHHITAGRQSAWGLRGGAGSGRSGVARGRPALLLLVVVVVVAARRGSARRGITNPSTHKSPSLLPRAPRTPSRRLAPTRLSPRSISRREECLFLCSSPLPPRLAPSTPISPHGAPWSRNCLATPLHAASRQARRGLPWGSHAGRCGWALAGWAPPATPPNQNSAHLCGSFSEAPTTCVSFTV